MTASANDILNRVLIIHHRSLPMYLGDARPWTDSTRAAEAEEMLSSIVADQKRTVDEIGQLLIERNHTIAYGEFPMTYTGLHDLSFRYVLKKMIELQRRDIASLEQSVEQLSGDELGRAVVERALGAAKAHLEIMQQAAGQQNATVA